MGSVRMGSSEEMVRSCRGTVGREPSGREEGETSRASVFHPWPLPRPGLGNSVDGLRRKQKEGDITQPSCRKVSCSGLEMAVW